MERGGCAECTKYDEIVDWWKNDSRDGSTGERSSGIAAGEV